MERAARQLWILVAGITVCASCAEPDASPLANAGRRGLECETIEEVFALPEEEIDLGRAILLLERELEPELDLELMLGRLDWLAYGVRRAARDPEDPIATVSALIQMVGLGGATGVLFRYESGQAAMHQALLEGNGNCVALSLVYLAVAERAGIEVHGICSPFHLYTRLECTGGSVEMEPTANVYFPEPREDLWFFTDRDRQTPSFGRKLSTREMIGYYAAAQVAPDLASKERAIELCFLAEEAFPDYPDLHRILTGIYQNLDRGDLALEHARHALALRPDDADAWRDMAFLYRVAGELEAARDAADLAVAIDPLFAPSWIVKGIIHLDRDELDEALEAAETALGICTDQLSDFRRPILSKVYVDPGELERDAYRIAAEAYHRHSLSYLAQAGTQLDRDGEGGTLHRSVVAYARTLLDQATRESLSSDLATVISLGSSGETDRAREALLQAEAKLAENPELRLDERIARLHAEAKRVCAPESEEEE